LNGVQVPAGLLDKLADWCMIVFKGEKR
jgi:hypothetical protein